MKNDLSPRRHFIVANDGFDEKGQPLAGAGLLSGTVIHLAGIVGLVDRIPGFTGKTVLIRSAAFLIP